MADISALYPQAPNPSQNNALTQLSNPANVINLLTGINALTKSTQEIQSRKAVGEIYRRNIRPDGTLDEHGAIRDIANNPDTAWSAPEAVGGMLQRQGQALQNTGASIANTTAQLDQRSKIVNFLSNSFSLIDSDKPTAEQVLNWAVMMKRNLPMIPSSSINSMTQSALTDPQGLAHGVASLKNMALGAGGTSERVQGPPDASGAPTTISKGAANLAAGGGIPTGLPPGSETSAGVMQSDLARAGNYASDIYPLNQALDLAKKLGPGGMAPGSSTRQEFESFVYGLMPSLVPESAREKIKNYAELEKYLQNNMSTRANNLGPHTNDGLAAAAKGSPNVHINDLAGIDLIKAQIGLRRMEHAQTLQASTAGPANYTSARAGFAAGQDPRAYMIDLMPPDEVAKLNKSLKGADRDKFNSSLRTAIGSGVITPPQARSVTDNGR